MRTRVKHLVVDSGGFIRNSPVHEYAENIYTVDGVVKEIRDKATKERLQFLPYELKLRDPLPESLKHMTEFSKKTGDYASLSAIDLKVLALIYQLQKEHSGTDHLKTEPSCVVSGTPSSIGKLQGFYNPKEDENDGIENEEDDGIENEKDGGIENEENGGIENEEDGGIENEEDDDSSENPEKNILIQNDDAKKSIIHDEEDGNDLSKSSNEDDDSDKEADSDDESWITPGNLPEIQKMMSNCEIDSDANVTVACITTDFAVQNVLLQMGLHVVSVDGLLIKHTRVFIFRCFSCFKTTTDMTKMFCPNCGNKTLKRVSVSVKQDGTKEIYINFKRPINTRGMKYSLPTQKGGMRAVNPILCADQHVPQFRQPKSALKKMDVFSPDFLAAGSPFALHDVYSRASGLGLNKKTAHLNSRKNPNELSKRTGNRKKK